MTTPAPLRRSERAGRLTLAALTLGSGISILDGSVVNIALKTIGDDLNAELDALQWVVNGYLVALASLVLVGGALGDRLGRRRVYLAGMVVFAVGSALCALAPGVGWLIAFRVLQGVGAALVTPGALAIIQAGFAPEDRAAAIGTWSGVSGIASAVGPFVGGWLLEHAGWPSIFWLNVPLCVIVIVVCLKFAPESSNPEAGERFDLAGALLSVVALAAVTYALTAAGGGESWIAGGIGVAAAVGFVLRQRAAATPLVPLRLFSDRTFTTSNLMTFLVYGAMGAVFFMLALQLQISVGWSPLIAGVATLPVTLALMLLSSRAGALSQRIGPRIPMTVGPLLCAVGVALLSGIGPGTTYVRGVLPGLTLFALGLALLVAPLTATVLAAAPQTMSGTASGVNNAVARAGSLLAVAALPAVVGLSGRAYADPVALTAAHHAAMLWCAAALGLGGVISWFGLPGPGTPGGAASDARP